MTKHSLHELTTPLFTINWFNYIVCNCSITTKFAIVLPKLDKNMLWHVGHDIISICVSFVHTGPHGCSWQLATRGRNTGPHGCWRQLATRGRNTGPHGCSCSGHQEPEHWFSWLFMQWPSGTGTLVLMAVHAVAIRNRNTGPHGCSCSGHQDPEHWSSWLFMQWPSGAGYSKLLKAASAKGHSIHHDGCAKIWHTYLNR